MASYHDTAPNNRFQTTAPCYRSSLLSLFPPCSLIRSTLLADIQIDRPLVFGNLASRQFRALHTVSHSFRSPYHSHSAPRITSHSAPQDPPHALYPVSVVVTVIVRIHACQIFFCYFFFSLLFLTLPFLCRLLYSISILIFFVSISIQQTRIIQGHVMDKLLRSLVQLHVTVILHPHTPHAIYTFFCHSQRHCTHART